MWGTLEKMATKALAYSTPLGMAWFFILFIFRMFVVAVVGGAVYGDEAGNFKCDTSQPGCQNVCFNRFSPISHMRFWAFHMMFVVVPSLIFMTYAQFQVGQVDKAEAQMNKLLEHGKEDESVYTSSDYTRLHKKTKKLGVEKKKVKQTVTKDGGVEEVVWTPKIRFVYILHLIAKLALECTFFYLSYLLQIQQSKRTGIQGFWVPEKYECTHGETEENSACSQNPLIPCWVSRPWEKTIFMLYMTIVTIISICLCLAEFFYVLTRTAKKGFEKKGEVRYARKQLTTKSLIGDTHTIASSVHDEKPYKKHKKNGIYPQIKSNGHVNGYANGHANGAANGSCPTAPPDYPESSPADERSLLIDDPPVSVNNSNNVEKESKPIEKAEE